MFLNIIMLSSCFKITLVNPSCSLDLVTKLLSTQGFLKISKDNNMVLNTKLSLIFVDHLHGKVQFLSKKTPKYFSHEIKFH